MKFSIVKRYKIFFAITITFTRLSVSAPCSSRASTWALTLPVAVSWIWNSKNPVTVSRVREVLKEKDLGNAIIQLESSDSNAKSSKGVLIRTGVISDEQRQQVMTDQEQGWRLCYPAC